MEHSKARCPSQTSTTYRKHIQSGNKCLQNQQSHQGFKNASSHSPYHDHRRQQHQSDLHRNLSSQASSSPIHSNTSSSTSSGSPPTSHLSSSSTSSRRCLQQADSQSRFKPAASAVTHYHLYPCWKDHSLETRAQSQSPRRKPEHAAAGDREDSVTPPPEQQCPFSKRFKAAMRDVFRKRHDDGEEVIYVQSHHWTDF